MKSHPDPAVKHYVPYNTYAYRDTAVAWPMPWQEPLLRRANLSPQVVSFFYETFTQRFIRDVHPTQVQVDELWSFVKKNKRICNQVTLPTGVTPGCGVRSPCRVISVS